MNQTLGNSKNVLITGGAGFIGSHLARQLVADGHRVTSLDLRDPNEAVTGVEYVRGDVLDRALVDRLVVAKQTLSSICSDRQHPALPNRSEKSYETNFSAP